MKIIDKNAHVNVIYPLYQVDYISFGVGIVYYSPWAVQSLNTVIFNVPTLLFCITVSRER